MDNFSTASYAIWPTISDNDANNCMNHYDISVMESRFISALPDTCAIAEKFDENL